MNQASQIIDDVLAEHGLVHENLHDMLRMAERLRIQGEGRTAVEEPTDALGALRAQIAMVAETLKAHFEREEGALENVLRYSGHAEALASLTTLWQEHAHLKAQVNRLGETASALGASGTAGALTEPERHTLGLQVEQLNTELVAHSRREVALFGGIKDLLRQE